MRDGQKKALELWIAKYDFLLAEEAITSDPAKMFEIGEQIRHARKKISDLTLKDSLAVSSREDSEEEAGRDCVVEIALPDSYGAFDDVKGRLLRYSLAKFLGISVGAVKIVDKRRGSTWVKIRVPEKAATRLVTLFREQADDGLEIFLGKNREFTIKALRVLEYGKKDKGLGAIDYKAIDYEKATPLLLSWGAEDLKSLDELMPLVYDNLCNMARQRLTVMRLEGILEPEEVVSEMYCRMDSMEKLKEFDMSNFMGLASRVIHHVLAGYVRYLQAAKRTGKEEALGVAADLVDDRAVNPEDVLIVREERHRLRRAVEGLAESHPIAARAVRYFYFIDYDHSMIARLLGVGKSRVVRELRFARIWLRRELLR